MRIAYINADPGIPSFGTKGSSIHVQEIIRAMINRGVDVDLYTTRVDGDVPEGLESVNIIKLPDAPKGDIETREKLCMDINRSLLALISNSRKYDFIYERYSLWSHSAIDFAKDNNIPSVLEINAPLIDEEKKYRKMVNEQEATSIARKNFSNSSLITVVSEPIKKYVSSFVDDSSHIYVMPNGVNTEKFRNSYKPEIDQLENKFVIGFVGSLKKWHGVSLLIDSFYKFLDKNPDSILLIVGDSKEKENLVNQIECLGIQDSVIMTGAVAHSQIPGYLASMDIAAAPYLDDENFYFSPLKIYEYMAAGVAVLASDVKQIRTIITDMENGKLFSSGDQDSLCENLQYLKDNKEMAKKIGNAGKKCVENNSWDNIANKILDMVSGIN
ncbi:MAG: glycosyltransferase [Nitrosopumilaceae archaeon]|nr:glycosyltransferase [Nitrosopumilaceae archaeon]